MSERDCYEVLVAGDGTDYDTNPDAYLHQAEDFDWDMLECIVTHELNRIEAQEIEMGNLGPEYLEEAYGFDEGILDGN